MHRPFCGQLLTSLICSDFWPVVDGIFTSGKDVTESGCCFPAEHFLSESEVIMTQRKLGKKVNT